MDDFKTEIEAFMMHSLEFAKAWNRLDEDQKAFLRNQREYPLAQEPQAFANDIVKWKESLEDTI